MDDCSVVEVTGGSTAEDDFGSLELVFVEEDVADLAEVDEENVLFFSDELEEFSETLLVCSPSTVGEIKDTLSDDDCGTLCDTSSEICDFVDPEASVSDEAGGSVFVSTDTEELDCGSGGDCSEDVTETTDVFSEILSEDAALEFGTDAVSVSTFSDKERFSAATSTTEKPPITTIPALTIIPTDFNFIFYTKYTHCK